MTGMTSATQNDCKAPALELPGVSVQPQADKAQITELVEALAAQV